MIPINRKRDKYDDWASSEEEKRQTRPHIEIQQEDVLIDDEILLQAAQQFEAAQRAHFEGLQRQAEIEQEYHNKAAKRQREEEEEEDRLLLQEAQEHLEERDEAVAQDNNNNEDAYDSEDDEQDTFKPTDTYRLRGVDYAQLGRPQAPSLNEEQEEFVFQHTETTYAIDELTQKPEVRVWGVTEKGNSVCVRVHGFEPYFFVNVSTEQEAATLSNKLNAYFGKLYSSRTHHRNAVADDRYVVRYEKVLGRSICGWHRNQPLGVMFKFYMAHPSHVSAARDSLEKANAAVTPVEIQTFEANVPYELRFMIDHGINGCEWMKIIKNYRLAEYPITTTQYELCVAASPDNIEAIPAMKRGDLAPLRYVSYDIEVIRRRKGFPTAKEDPIIMIAVALQITGKGIVHKMVFATKPSREKGYEEIDHETSVYVCQDERELLFAFREYVRVTDPEALTGWNTCNFDMPYMADRAEELGCYKSFMQFTRLRNKSAWIRQTTYQSKAHGAKKSNELLCEGRFEFDGLTFMLRGQMTKYRSYKLNYISKKVLNDQKLDVDYTEIPILYDEGTDEDRARLAYYNLKDALLPLQLLEKLQAVINGIEQARVTGVSLKWLLARGQGIKTFSNLLR
jgi:DNA polymerase delta subunit 1